MGSISASGITCAAPILALAASLAPASASADGASATLEIAVKGARSSKGVIRLAICPPDSGFPDCKGKAIRSADLKIQGGAALVRFADLPSGNYAISLFHDANANGKLDTFLGIPREGYGFSRNPPFRPRAPRFDEAMIAVEGDARITIALRYLL